MSALSWPIAVALVAAVLNAVIGVLAYVRSRGESLYRSLALISLAFSMWSLSFMRVYPEFTDPFWMKMMFTPLALLPGATLSFVWTFTGIPRGVRFWRVLPLYGAGVVTILLLWVEHLSLLRFRAAFLMGGIPIFGLGLSLLYFHWRDAADAAEKNRRGYVLAAFMIAAFGGLSDFVPILVGPRESLANLSLMLYSLIVLKAVEEHHLLDLRSALRRSLVLIAASSLLALLLTGLAWATRQVEGTLFLNFFLLSLILVVVLPLVWERINRAFNQLVFRRQAGHERALEKFDRAIEGVSNLEGVEAATVEAVRRTWGADAEVVWVRESLRGIEPRKTASPELLGLFSDGPQVYTAAGLRREGSKRLRRLGELLVVLGRRAIMPVVRDGDMVGVILAGPASQGFYDLADVRALRRLGVTVGRVVKSVELTAEILHADRLSHMGTLAAGIAHEVRNPLSCILGAVELLNIDISQEKKDECLAILKDEVLRLNGIVSELVDYSSPRSRNAKVEWKEAWERVERLLRTDLPENLELKCEGERAELGVSGDHMQQILINLIKNAVRSATSQKGKPEVVVSLNRVNGRAVLNVLDNGPGIPDDVLRRLFVPFETRSPGGTGLGLAMVRRLAELYGGRAWAENRSPGPGARFVVELPLAASEP